MKKKFMICMTAIAVMLVGCQNDNNTSEPTFVDEGKPTYFTLTFTQPVSRAVSPPATGSADNNATIAETTLNTVDVLIFHPNGALQSHTVLNPDNFTYSAGSAGEDVFTASSRNVHTTTGEKYIYAGVNLPAAMVEQIKSSPTDRKVDCVYNIDFGELYDLSSTGAGMAMFNADYVKETFVLDPTATQNIVTIPLKRLSAKVAVKMGVDPVAQDGGITYTNYQYTVGNVNKKIYPMPQYKYQDPNYNSEIGTDGRPAYRKDFTMDDEYIDVNANNVGNRNLLVKYVPENTSTRQLKDETTFVSISIDFVPDNILVRDGNGGFINEAFDASTYDPDPSGNDDKMFVVRTLVGKMSFFLDKTIAEEYQQYLTTQMQMPSTLLEFSDLTCYYTVFLNLDPNRTGNPSEAETSGNVIRNEFYLMTITDIGTIGSPYPRDPGEEDNPKDPDGGTQIDKPTDITVNLEVLPWTLVEDDVNLY